MAQKDLGMVTAYAYALSQGYTGTEEEFAEGVLASAEYADNAQASATAAAQSKTDAQAAASSVQASAQQIATNTADIADIKSDLSEYASGTYEVGDMIPDTCIKANGSPSAYTGWYATDFVKVPVGDNLIITADASSSGAYNAFYSAGKTHLGTNFSFQNGTNIITIPEGAVYFRLSMPNTVSFSVISETERRLDSLENSVNDVSAELHSEIDTVTENINGLADEIGVEYVEIPLGMEVGGFDTSGRPVTSNTRSRSPYPVPVDMACPTIVFPEGTKHRIAYYSSYDYSIITMSDWSTAEVDTLVFPTISTAGSGTAFKVLVGYTDDRTITADNLPIPSIKYETNTNNGVKYVNGYFATATPAYISNYNGSGYNLSAIIPVEPNTVYRANKFRNTLLLDKDLQTVRVLTASDITNNKITTGADEYYVVYTWRTTDTNMPYFAKADDYIAGAVVENLVPTPLKGKYLSLLGDSISAYAGTIPSGYDAYYTGSNSGVDSPSQMWWSVLCDELGMIPLVINGYSGSAVTQLQDSAHVSKIPMSSDERCDGLDDGTTDPDIIIIAGGVNDYSYAQSAQSEPLEWDGLTAPTLGDSFTEAYACMIKKLQTNYPNAIVVCLSTWFTMRGDDNGYTLTHTVGSNKYTQTDYNNAIKYVAEQMHVPFIDVSNIGFNRSNFYPTYAQDSSTIPTHPNKVGQGVMGRAIAKKLPELVKAFLA